MKAITRDARSAGLVAGLYRALRAGDTESLRQLLAPGFRAELTPGMPWGLGEHPIDGADAMVRKGWGVVARQMCVIAQPDEILPARDVVVVPGTYLGCARSTGAPLDAWFVHLWRVRDGRVVALCQITDTAAWLRAAEPGALRPASSPGSSPVLWRIVV